MQSHKRPLIEAAQAAGYEVWVASAGQAPGQEVAGARHMSLKWSRADSVLGAMAKALPESVTVSRLLGTLQPDVLHNIALKPSVLGSIAALGRPLKVINSINGLGYLFVSNQPIARLGRTAVGVSLRAAQAMQSGITVFQNEDDAAYGVQSLGLQDQSTQVIAGSGIDIGDFTPSPEPAGDTIRFAILSRMLAQKGISVAVDAIRQARALGHDVELMLCGAPDPGNPSSLSADQLESWSTHPEITWLGHVEDIRALLSSVHAVIQPSLGGEGLPRALLEAAAMARPMIATDVPGNRSVVLPQQTGLRVPPGDPDALSSAIIEMIGMGSDHRQTLGQAARRRAMESFSTATVRKAHEDLYQGLLSP